MYRHLIVIATFLFFSCNKPSTPPVTPNNPTPNNPNNPNNPQTPTAWYIPNWLTNDTLTGLIVDSSGTPTGYDTIYTLTINDTSFIVHKNKRYYLWKEAAYTADTLIPNQNSYANCVISPTTKIADAISKSIGNVASPNKYVNAWGDTMRQPQSLSIGDPTHFKVNVAYGVYSGRLK